jgi:hypothetical protein
VVAGQNNKAHRPWRNRFNPLDTLSVRQYLSGFMDRLSQTWFILIALRLDLRETIHDTQHILFHGGISAELERQQKHHDYSRKRDAENIQERAAGVPPEVTPGKCGYHY